jgi:SAM-dependent methyltransferase
MTEFSARHLYRGCPLCDHPVSFFPEYLVASCAKHPLHQPALPDTITWCRCANCTHIFTNGYFTDEALAVLFSRTNEHQRFGADFENQRRISARIVERVATFARAGGAWLDVGFGNGSLLFSAYEWGYTPVGIDLRPGSVAALAKVGIEGHSVDIASLDHNGRYVVVSMADVVEHMPFPKEGLAAAHRLLRADGVLFLSMPNSDSIPRKILSANTANPYWGEIEHYHNFGRARLFALLEETGFQPLHFDISERSRLSMEIIARKCS